MTAIPDIPAGATGHVHDEHCLAVGELLDAVYSQEKPACDCDSMGGRFGAHHPECPAASGEPDHSLAHDPNGGTVLTLAFGAVLGSLVLVGLLVLVAKTRGWL